MLAKLEPTLPINSSLPCLPHHSPSSFKAFQVRYPIVISDTAKGRYPEGRTPRYQLISHPIAMIARP